MQRTIVVDEEYQTAARAYKEVGAKAQAAVETFKSAVKNMIARKAIAGKTAGNMDAFLGEIALTLRATFKEQLTLASVLCGEYTGKMETADKRKTYAASTKEARETSFRTISETAQAEGVLRLDKTALQNIVSQLKTGPLKAVEECKTQVENISFSESAGAVREKNGALLQNTLAALNDLYEIFTAFVERIESVVAEFTETDKTLAASIRKGSYPRGAPSVTKPANPVQKSYGNLKRKTQN